jgi:hypothetical protein
VLEPRRFFFAGGGALCALNLIREKSPTSGTWEWLRKGLRLGIIGTKSQDPPFAMG